MPSDSRIPCAGAKGAIRGPQLSAVDYPGQPTPYRPGGIESRDQSSRPGSANSGAAGTASSRRSAEAPAVTATATLECKTAVDRANAMLASAVKVRGALAEHDRILNDPSNRDLSVAQLLQKLAVSEQAGASESARFEQELDAYRAVVDRCDLRVP